MIGIARTIGHEHASLVCVLLAQTSRSRCNVGFRSDPAVKSLLGREAYANIPIAAVECPDLTLSEFGLTYSALILAARITFAHLAVSVLMTTANSSGELTDASRPSCAIRSRVSAFATIRSSSACTLSMMTTGVALGANSPNQEMTSKPGKPDSASVG